MPSFLYRRTYKSSVIFFTLLGRGLSLLILGKIIAKLLIWEVKRLVLVQIFGKTA
jgi:hypothetical protein